MEPTSVPGPIEHRLPGAGVQLQAYEWPGTGRPIVLAHATGFHARCWDAVVAELPSRRVVALDMRGHGRSDIPSPPYRWAEFGDDIVAALRALGLEGVLAAGHSKGGYAIVRAAALAPELFAGLLLLDPVILSADVYGQRRQGGEHFAARRRDRWSSPAEMFEAFRGRDPFARWDERVLRDYCEFGLLPAPDGDGYVLACPPIVEAAIYQGAIEAAAVYDEVARVEAPVRVVRARPRQPGSALDMTSSPTAPDLASRFRRGTDAPAPQYSHFIPMEDPAFVAAQLALLEAMVGLPPTGTGK